MDKFEMLGYSPREGNKLLFFLSVIILIMIFILILDTKNSCANWYEPYTGYQNKPLGYTQRYHKKRASINKETNQKVKYVIDPKVLEEHQKLYKDKPNQVQTQPGIPEFEWPTVPTTVGDYPYKKFQWGKPKTLKEQMTKRGPVK
jgi:hypothetical protein